MREEEEEEGDLGRLEGTAAPHHAVGIAAAQGVNIGSGAGETAITGTVRITGELIVNDIVFSTHKHTGVQPAGGTSAGPTN